MEAVLAELGEFQQDAEEDIDFQFKGPRPLCNHHTILIIYKTSRTFLGLTSKAPMKKQRRLSAVLQRNLSRRKRGVCERCTLDLFLCVHDTDSPCIRRHAPNWTRRLP
jgi:hypothetical protein